MKILVIGGMHGNEPLGPALVRSLKASPIAGVDAIIGNPRALRANTRFTEKDLNRSFPGNARSTIYEERRASKLAKLCRQYDLVLDFHNALADNNDCAFIGQNADGLLSQVASYLDLKRVIVADYDCINKYVPRCISIEISVSSERMALEPWRQAIQQLAISTSLPPATDLTYYRYVLAVLKPQADTVGLTECGLQSFDRVPDKISTKLGITPPAYTIFTGKNYQEGLYTGVLNKLP